MTTWKKYNLIQQKLKHPPRDSGEYLRQMYGIEAKEEERQAIGRGRLAAFAVAVMIAVLVTCLILLFRVTTAHAAEKPAWLPPATTSSDWLAILYILGLVVIGGAMGIAKLISEGRRG